MASRGKAEDEMPKSITTIELQAVSLARLWEVDVSRDEQFSEIEGLEAAITSAQPRSSDEMLAQLLIALGRLDSIEASSIDDEKQLRRRLGTISDAVASVSESMRRQGAASPLEQVYGRPSAHKPARFHA